MKKLCTLLALIMLMTCVPMSGCTAEPEPNPATDFEYEVNEDGGITILYYHIETPAEAVIPAQIDGKDVTTIGKGAFRGMSHVTTVFIPDTVKVISVNAFLDCSNLQAVKLSNNLTTIGAEAFKNCTSLKQITIPGSVTEWGYGAFMSAGLKQVKLEDGLRMIGDDAFCLTKLTEVTVPGSVEILKSGAFGACYDLEKITLNEGLVTIEQNAFSGSSKFTEIVIPATVKNIQEMSFSSCTALKKVMFEGNAPSTYIYISGVTGEREEPWFVSYTVYYHKDAKGFTSPEWNGYPTEIW